MSMTLTQKWLALVCLLMAQFMIVLDVSILNIALPSIEKDFGLSVSELQWLITAYSLTFGGFLLFGGRAADLYGRKKIFMWGVGTFVAVSFLIGSTTTAALLVPLRALQGFAAAFVSPAALSFILTLFEDEKRRNRALSYWGAISAGGAVVGLLLGGFLTEVFNWRWNFFVNIPFGLLVIGAAWKLLPAHVAEEKDKSLDVVGAVVVTTGLMIFVYASSMANEWGWLSLNTVGSLLLSVIALALFVRHEKRTKHPLMPLSIFRVGNVAVANLIRLPISASLYVSFFFLTLYIQNILHFSPIKAGLTFLPMTLLIAASSIFAPRLVERIGIRNTLIIAPLFLATGLFLLGFLPVEGSYVLNILPSLLLMPIGLGLSFVALSIAATYGVPPHESGLASGILNTTQQLGGAMGLAILSSVAAAATARHGGDGLEAVLYGFHTAFFVGSVLALSASAVAYFFVKKREVI